MVWLINSIVEFGPVLLFFGADYFYGFTTGVVAMVVATLAGFLFNYYRKVRLPFFAIASTIAFLIFGLATIVFDDATYFILSDTILDGIFALLLLATARARQPLLKTLFSNTFAISDRAWRILSLRWGLLFLILAIVNEVIRLNYTEDVWVIYKLVNTIFIIAFGCYQFTLSIKERIPQESNWLGMRTK